MPLDISHSEPVERAALIDLHASVSAADRDALGLIGETKGGAFVSVARAAPPSAITLNRTLGLGSDAPAIWDELDGVLSLYRDEGVERYFIQIGANAQPPDLPAWLAAAGLEEVRAWRKFERGAEPADPVDSVFSVKEIGPEHAAAFSAIAADAFDLGPLGAHALKGLPGRPDWRIFMTFDGDEPAGVGALYLKDGAAWLDWGATAPAFRRRGGQTALLSARIEAARAAGAQKLFTCTGVDMPGDPQRSYANILRAGFAEADVRANWAPKRG